MMQKKIAFLFCSDYFEKDKPDMSYEAEYHCVINSGKEAYLFCLDTFLESNTVKLKVSKEKTTLIYRGWMLIYEQYTLLYNVLLTKGYFIINSPEQYKQCHELPSWYSLLEDITAKSVWTSMNLSKQTIISALNSFDQTSLIVKDFVKSRKHEWYEACFIPNASKTEEALQIIQNFIDRQGKELIGGVVLR